ncbi:hypothetical protein QVD17_04792 [Tagetes erecta]|uniref:Uncharacterized protein n=1 Tax=Tagetes erecta TaxID=13708 RepID=A0AAD8PA14_TARER|nr:hypothetical protein QVD17_04792 [Tagetes erecta]
MGRFIATMTWLLCVELLATRVQDLGQPWFGCPLWPSMDCKFFMWKEDVDAVFAKEGNWKVLELKNKALEMKIENLEVEKMILVEENKKLRMKIAMSNCAGMKVYGKRSGSRACPRGRSSPSSRQRRCQPRPPCELVPHLLHSFCLQPRCQPRPRGLLLPPLLLLVYTTPSSLKEPRRARCLVDLAKITSSLTHLS